MQRAYSMGCYGDANARTPNLDAFSRQGARLDAAMSTTPVLSDTLINARLMPAIDGSLEEINR
jgi:hypothetical protein